MSKVFGGEDEKKTSSSPVDCDQADAQFQVAMYAAVRSSELETIADYLRGCGREEQAKACDEKAAAIASMSESEWIEFVGDTALNNKQALPGEVLRIRYKDTDRMVDVRIPNVDAIEFPPDDCSPAKIDRLFQVAMYTVYYPAVAVDIANQLRACGKTSEADQVDAKAQSLTLMSDDLWVGVVGVSLFYAGGQPGQKVAVGNRNPNGEPPAFEVTVITPEQYQETYGGGQ